MQKKSISIVIPNYNGRKLLEQNLPSVFSALHEVDIEFEIIISDDASTDDSLDFIKRKYPEVCILESIINKGFSPTINKGIRTASKDLVFVLNSDVSLTPKYFHRLFSYFDSSDTFGVTGQFIGINDDKIQEGGKYPHLTISKKIQPINFYPEKEDDFKIPTLYLSGGSSLIDRRKLQLIDGFDEIFAPFYVEDLELSIRAWRAGWKCYYEHRAICRHPVSATISNYHKRRKIWIITQRNKLILHSLHLENRSKLLWYLRQSITFIFQGIVFRWKYHEAFFQFLKRRDAIKNSKTKYKNLFGDKLLTIEQIMEDMRLRLEQCKIIKFK